MGAIVRNVVNDQLLRLSYKDPKNIKRFLRNWGGLEGLSEKGDTVATCILTDLKTVTAIDLDKYHKSDRAEFNKAYRKGKLSHYQYMSIAYVLVLGYTQDAVLRSQRIAILPAPTIKRALLTWLIRFVFMTERVNHRE